MGKKAQFLNRLEIKNLLSLADVDLELKDLNVLIGPNGSGKSNLIHIVDLIRAAATDIYDVLRRGGRDWIWKGQEPRAPVGRVAVTATVLPLFQGPGRRESRIVPG